MPRILFTASGDNKNQLGVKKEKEEGESEGKKFDTPKKKKGAGLACWTHRRYI